jgi:hypothetical protein
MSASSGTTAPPIEIITTVTLTGDVPTLVTSQRRTLPVRAPGHLEHRFRGKPNTHSGGSRTPIPGRSNALMG